MDAFLGLADSDLGIHSQETTGFTGILVWKITNYARHFESARSGQSCPIYSPPFFTSRHGYKMCALALSKRRRRCQGHPHERLLGSDEGRIRRASQLALSTGSHAHSSRSIARRAPHLYHARARSAVTLLPETNLWNEHRVRMSIPHFAGVSVVCTPHVTSPVMMLFTYALMWTRPAWQIFEDNSLELPPNQHVRYRFEPVWMTCKRKEMKKSVLSSLWPCMR